MKKRILSGILMVFMLLPLAAGCAKNDTPSQATNASEAPSGEITTEAATGEVRLTPDLPERDFGGYTFTFLSHRCEDANWITADPRELVAEEQNSDPINDAVYERNLHVMEKFNCKIAMVTSTDEKSMLSKTVKAGDDVYQAILIYNNNVPSTITSDLLYNLEQLPYLDLSKPWWDPAAKALSVMNKSFVTAGDLFILDNDATNALLFNKDMLRSLGYDMPYQSVIDGKWTLDAFSQIIKGATKDLNGDGKLGIDDQFGYIIFNDTFQAMLCGAGGSYALKDANDIPYMTLATEANIAISDKIMDIIYDSNNVLNLQKAVTSGDANLPYYNMFQNNQALFMWTRMRVVEYFRGMEANFGILPMPKYDEAQENYHSLVNPYTGILMGVPKSVTDTERCSIILEALAAESRYTLQPAYYDVTLTRKYARDTESQEMLNIIFNNRIYDIGGAFAFGDVFNGINTLVKDQKRDIVSYYEKNSAKMQKAIDKLVGIVQNLG